MIRRCPKLPAFPALFVSVLSSLLAPSLAAQTATTIAAGTSYDTEETPSSAASGSTPSPTARCGSSFPRSTASPSSAIRNDDASGRSAGDDAPGANPVDFEIDGDIVWYLCNGESRIDAGRSIFGRLDTLTGQIREWIVPGWPSRRVLPGAGRKGVDPADQPEAAVGRPGRRSRSIDYRSGTPTAPATQTIAYSDVVLGPDGALWMTDFGNNRIVRYDPGALRGDVLDVLRSPARDLQPFPDPVRRTGQFLWISQVSGGGWTDSIRRTARSRASSGSSNPIHFDLFGGRVYVAEADGANGQIAVLDPLLAARRRPHDRARDSRGPPAGQRARGRHPRQHHDPDTFASPPEDRFPRPTSWSTSAFRGFLRTQLPGSTRTASRSSAAKSGSDRPEPGPTWCSRRSAERPTSSHPWRPSWPDPSTRRAASTSRCYEPERHAHLGEAPLPLLPRLLRGARRRSRSLPGGKRRFLPTPSLTWDRRPSRSSGP